jgi:hypothetical protein
MNNEGVWTCLNIWNVILFFSHYVVCSLLDTHHGLHNCLVWQAVSHCLSIWIMVWIRLPFECRNVGIIDNYTLYDLSSFSYWFFSGVDPSFDQSLEKSMSPSYGQGGPSTPGTRVVNWRQHKWEVGSPISQPFLPIDVYLWGYFTTLTALRVEFWAIVSHWFLGPRWRFPKSWGYRQIIYRNTIFHPKKGEHPWLRTPPKIDKNQHIGRCIH